jgi:acyl-CoA synthetase (AMP-forming)/AMP-acid ligase II
MSATMNLAVSLLSVGCDDALAIIDGDVELSYRSLRDRVERAARVLAAVSADRRAPVAILSENSAFFIVSYLAVIRAGRAAVPLPVDLPAENAVHLIRDANIDTIVASPRHRARVTAWASGAGLTVLSEPELSVSTGSIDTPLADTTQPVDLAALMFTSGSMGRPKAVMVSHGNIACNTKDIVSYLELSSRDRALLVLPLCYCFGLSVLHAHLAVGASLVISNEFMYPEKVLRELEDRACTGLAGVPSTYQILLRKSRFAQSHFPSLRWLQQAGGRLPDTCIVEILDAFPKVRLYIMYGQTEATARLSYLPPERLRDKLGSIGKGLPSTRLEILKADGSPVSPGTNEIGEIIATGDNITSGYWNDPQETAKHFRGGRLHTGDLARVDADGFVYIVGRERDVIKCGGHRVAAREIEDAIAERHDVVEVAVVGVPHDILGEGIVAFVTLSTDDGEPDLLAHCRRRLPPWRVPEAVVHLRSLPHNSSGKVARATLQRYAEQLLVSTAGPIEPDFLPASIERKSESRPAFNGPDLATKALSEADF